MRPEDIQRALDANVSLNATLAHLGLTTSPGPYAGQRNVHDASGAILCTGWAGDVWEWLRGRA